MRILHVANFGYNNFGAAFYNTDRKLSAGFVRNGHFVYEFSLRDLARWGTVLRSKRFGAAWANKALLQTCERMAPDLVLLGHAQLITADTLREIRRRFPATRIALWYVDPLFYPDKIAYIREFAPFLDAIFATTGGEWLEQLGLPSVLRGFFPNVSERSVENSENFRRRQFDHELIYCGTVGDDVPRRQFMESLQQRLHDLPLRFQGLLGQPPIEGIGYVQALAGSRMGLNHSRRNDVTLYSSDRIAQLTGHGLLALTPRIPGFELLFGEDQVAYFDSLDELVDKVRHYHARPDEAARVAEAGWRQAHSCCGAERVARYMEEVIVGHVFSEPYEWLGHVFRPVAV